MIKFTGKGVAGAMCIGKASLFNKSPYKVIKRKITDLSLLLQQIILFYQNILFNLLKKIMTKIIIE